MNQQYEKDDLSNIREDKDFELPDLLRVAPFDMRTDMRVETSILDPVVNTESNCRFVIPNKGILNSATARINLGVKCSGEGADKVAVFLPLANGVYSMVNRAVLKVGTKVLSEIVDLNYYMAYRSNLLHSETVKNIESVVSGRGLSYGVNPYNLTATSQQTNLSNAYSYTSRAGANTNQNDYNLDVPYYSNMLLTQEVNFQLSLKELFPILSQWNLPLFMMKEQVSIELFYSDNEEHTTVDRVQNTTHTAVVVANTNKCFLICDYIYYDEEKMNIIAERQNANPVFDYVEHQLVKSSIADNPAGASFIRNVGGAGQYVNKIMSMNNQILNKEGNMTTILGPYASGTPDVGSLAYNLIYNDVRLFPVNVSNLAHVASNIQYAEVIALQVPIAHFTKGKVASPAQTCVNIDIPTGCDGKRFFITTKLLNNNRINQRGVLLQQHATFNGVNTINRSYLELLKGMKLVNGYLETMFL